MFYQICSAFISIIFMKIYLFLPNKQIETIVLDKEIANFYKNYFKNNKKFLFLDTRFFSKNQKIFFNKNEIFISIYLKSIFKKIILRQFTVKQIYILEIIKRLNPKYILTFTDYDPFFLSLKKYFPKKKLIVICHTFRSDTTLKQLQKKLSYKKCLVDLVLMWGEKNINYYKKICKSKYYASGSLKNNLFPIKNFNLEKKKIVFISQYRHSTVFLQQNKYYYKALLSKTLQYVKKKKLQLVILGNQIDKSFEEFHWYKKILGNYKFEFKTKKDNLGSYINTINYQYFLCFSSSLGFELAARNKRVVFFFKNKFALKNPIYNQSFMKAKSGPIWTNKYSFNAIKRLLDYLIYAPKTIIKKNKKKYIHPYINYDYKLQNTKKFLKKNGLRIF